MGPLIRRAKEEFFYDAPSICVWFGDRMQWFTGKPRIAFPVFETDVLPKSWIHHLGHADAIFVASEWARSVIREQFGHEDGPDYVVREGYDPEIFHPIERDGFHHVTGRPGRKNGIPDAISVAKWERRKGQDVLIKALSKVADEGAELYLTALWANPFVPDWYQQVTTVLGHHGFRFRNFSFVKKGVEILVARRMPLPELARHMAAADFGIYPHRAEGWGLPIIETMACGTPVIATFHSGPTEYLDGLRCSNIEFELVDANDPPWFTPPCGRWAEPSVEHLAEQIRWHVEHPASPGLRERLAEHAKQFTWKESAKRVLAALRELRS